MSIDIPRGLSLNNFTDRLKGFMDDAAITEITCNRPDEVATYDGEKWTTHDIKFSFDELDRMFRAAKVFSSQTENQVLAGTLATGHRLQMVRPPACSEGVILFAIRNPSRTMMSLHDFDDLGFFQHHGSVDFIVDQVLRGKTIVVAGATNSGKTTFINAMGQVIPLDERIITIEDVPELRLPHRHIGRLFYDPKGISATQQLRVSLRLKPDRVILGECRGGEALDFIHVAASGHQGSMTSCHAKDCHWAIKRLAGMAMQNEVCPPYITVMDDIKDIVDTVIHIAKEGDQRFITEIEEL